MEETVTTFWDALRTGAIIVGGGAGAFVLYQAGRAIYDDVHERMVQARQDRITLDDLEQQRRLANIRTIQADARGRYPLLYGVSGLIRDPNSLRAFTLDAVRETWPAIERLDAIAKVVLAGRGWPAAPAQAQLLDAGPAVQVGAAWPASVPIADVFRDRRPTLHNLVVGVRPGANGAREVIGDSLHNLMHVLEVGASGWGKSSWLRSFLWQIAKAREPCEVVAIDTAGSEFNVLRGWGKLRYPVARSTQDAIAVLDQVSQEIDDRKRRFEQDAPIASKLTEYNDATGADLPPWIVAIDEGTNLLNQAGVGEPLRAAVQTARQYGVYILLAGQSAKSSVVDTQVRDNFSTRLCFRTSPTSSRVVLDDRAASDLHDKGRAIVQIPGREQCEVMGPWVTREDFRRALSNGGPRHAMPVVLSSEPEPTPSKGKGKGTITRDQVREVLERHARGESDTAIAGALWHPTTYYIERVRAILDDNQDAQDHAPGGSVRGARAVDWCDHCGNYAGDVGEGVTFKPCDGCGVAVCSECATGGLCPDCQEGA